MGATVIPPPVIGARVALDRRVANGQLEVDGEDPSTAVGDQWRVPALAWLSLTRLRSTRRVSTEGGDAAAASGVVVVHMAVADDEVAGVADPSAVEVAC